MKKTKSAYLLSWIGRGYSGEFFFLRGCKLNRKFYRDENDIYYKGEKHY